MCIVHGNGSVGFLATARRSYPSVLVGGGKKQYVCMFTMEISLPCLGVSPESPTRGCSVASQGPDAIPELLRFAR